MSFKSTSHRVVALVAALLFLGTSVGFSLVVIWQVKKDNQQSKINDTIQKLQNDQNNQSKENQLQGTKLSGFTPVSKIDKLETIDTKPGTGDAVKAGDKVTVNYTGAVASTGVIFQSSLDSGQPVTFGLDQVIKGWTEGIPGMKAGGTRRLLIPASLAYGSTPPQGSGIPADADLVFDVELIKIN